MWVLDTSSLLNLKHLPIDKQWAIFRTMEAMVETGAIAVSDHVVSEISAITYPDVPGAWANGIRAKRCHPPEASYPVLAEVMSTAGDVVEVDSPGDPADPYVLALALELSRDGISTTVVTDDFVDRLPIKRSMESGCQRLGLACCRCPAFLESVTATMQSLNLGTANTLPFGV